MLTILYSIQSAATYLGIGKTKLYELINTGQLKARKQGRKTCISEGDLHSYIEGLEIYIPRNKGDK